MPTVTILLKGGSKKVFIYRDVNTIRKHPRSEQLIVYTCICKMNTE